MYKISKKLALFCALLLIYPLVFAAKPGFAAQNNGGRVTEYAKDADEKLNAAKSEYAKDADLMICEGMYGEADKQQKAREHKHMTMQEAAKLAAEAKPKELWLTHYSPSLNYPEEYMAGIRKIFPAAKAAKDGWTMELVFPEEA